MDEREALLVEREGYVRRGLKDRVKQVDEALERFGDAPETTDHEDELEQAVPEKPVKRGPGRPRKAT